MRSLSKLFLLLFLCTSCTIFKGRETRSAQKIKHEVSHSAVFSKAFTGFTLFDPGSRKTLVDVNGNRYFTPASCAKILTLATCLELLKDSVPSMQYYYADSILVFKGVGDPTFLHPKFQYWRKSYDFLADTTQPIQLYFQYFLEPRFGPGWAWDDYTESYQPEKSPFPIYGNTLRILGQPSGRYEIEPTFFRTIVEYPHYDEYGIIPRDIGRRETDNMVGMKRLPREGEEIWIPFRPPYWEGMLADTLHRREIDPAHYHLEFPADLQWSTYYSTPTDTVLRRMMYQSDNFIAEQMLLVCANLKFKLLKQDTMIQWMLHNSFMDLPQPPKWVDGSGLSRYNLMTPQSLTQVLSTLWQEQPHERLLSLFPAGGVSGTIADWYAGKENKPYVFAKTGSMGGVNCLSGYLVCKSGKVLIFSFMHNNYVGSNRPWKAEMQTILEHIRDRF